MIDAMPPVDLSGAAGAQRCNDLRQELADTKPEGKFARRMRDRIQATLDRETAKLGGQAYVSAQVGKLSDTALQAAFVFLITSNACKDDAFSALSALSTDSARTAGLNLPSLRYWLAEYFNPSPESIKGSAAEEAGESK